MAAQQEERKRKQYIKKKITKEAKCHPGPITKEAEEHCEEL